MSGKALADAAAEQSPPRMHPANLAVRFALEVGALIAMAWWGLERTITAWRYVSMVGVLAIAAVAWGVFAVPNDPSRGGTPILVVPGVARLALELAFFVFANWAIADLGNVALAIGYGGIAVLHHAFSYDRIRWLVRQ